MPPASQPKKRFEALDGSVCAVLLEEHNSTEYALDAHNRGIKKIDDVSLVRLVNIVEYVLFCVLIPRFHLCYS